MEELSCFLHISVLHCVPSQLCRPCCMRDFTSCAETVSFCLYSCFWCIDQQSIDFILSKISHFHHFSFVSKKLFGVLFSWTLYCAVVVIAGHSHSLTRSLFPCCHRYLLQPKGNGSKSKSDDLGTLRLKLTYIEDTVLPSACYTPLCNLLLKSPDVKVKHLSLLFVKCTQIWCIQNEYFCILLLALLSITSISVGVTMCLFLLLSSHFLIFSLQCSAHLSVSRSHPGGHLQRAIWGCSAYGPTAAPPQSLCAFCLRCGSTGVGQHSVSICTFAHSIGTQ